MGNIKDNVAIKVCNYNPFILSVNTNISSHTLQPCYDYNCPTVDAVSFSELVHVNSNSTAIRNGLIRFDKDVEKDVYEALNISNWENIITNAEIEDIILNPDKDKLQKLVDIRESSIFDRVVAIYQGLLNGGEHDVSNRVMDTIETRKKEFRKGLSVSRIQITAKDVPTTSNEDVENIKKQNEDLQLQLNKMQEMMSKLLESQKVNTEPESNQKKVGRPKKQ